MQIVCLFCQAHTIYSYVAPELLLRPQQISSKFSPIGCRGDQGPGPGEPSKADVRPSNRVPYPSPWLVLPADPFCRCQRPTMRCDFGYLMIAMRLISSVSIWPVISFCKANRSLMLRGRTARPTGAHRSRRHDDRQTWPRSTRSASPTRTANSRAGSPATATPTTNCAAAISDRDAMRAPHSNPLPASGLGNFDAATSVGDARSRDAEILIARITCEMGRSRDLPKPR